MTTMTIGGTIYPIEFVKQELNNILSGEETPDDEFYENLYAEHMSDIPYGVAKGRTGTFDEWIVDNLENYYGHLLKEEECETLETKTTKENCLTS